MTLPAPRATAAEARLVADRFDDLVWKLEDMALPPQPVDGPERHRLRHRIEYVVQYLEAPRWQEERILQLQRQRDEFARDHTGVYDGDRETFTRVQIEFEDSLDRIDAEIRRLRSMPTSEEPFAEAPSVGKDRVRSATPKSRAYGPTIEELEALLGAPGYLHPRTKRALRQRLDALIAFLDAPLSRDEQIDALKRQIAVLERFDKIQPVGGSHALYEAYRRVIEGETMRLRDLVRRLEEEGQGGL
jgi:hypothetical protein